MVGAVAMYPQFGIDQVRNRQGQHWTELIDEIKSLPVSDPLVMAFTLTLRRLQRAARLNGFLCSDPLCAVCAAEVLTSFSSSEQELLNLYRIHLDEITTALKKIPHRRPSRAKVHVA